MTKTIVISGWYGFGNVGDEAILQAMVDTFKKEWIHCNIKVLSFNPGYTIRVQGIEAVNQIPYGKKNWVKSLFSYEILTTLKAIRDCDVFIIGGGGFLSDWQPEVPKQWLRQMKIAKFFNKKTMLYGIGAGPFITENGRKTTSYYINKFVDKVTVRDQVSYNVLINDVGINKDKITLTNDPVYNIGIEDQNPNYTHIKKSIVYINFIKIYYNNLWSNHEVKYSSFIIQINKLISSLLEKNHEVIFISFFKGFDELILKDLNHKLEIKYINNQNDLAKIKRDALFIISMRFHLSLLSILNEIPVLPVVYHHKTFAKVQDYDIKYFLEVGDGTVWRNSYLKSEILTDFMDTFDYEKYQLQYRTLNKKYALKERDNVMILKELIKEQFDGKKV